MTTAHFRDLLRTARQQIRLAIALYQGRGAVQQLANAVGANFRTYQMAHVAAAALVFPDHVHLSIGGTNDRYDWLQNLSAGHVTHGGYVTHSGYAASAGYILSDLRRGDLRDLAARRRLIIGGHSAGGAIAQLVALDYGFDPSDVITFGAPRVFAPESAAEYVAEAWDTTQFAAGGDPVVRLPLRRFRRLFGKAEYANTVAPLVLLEDGRVVTDRESGCVSRAVRIAAACWLGATAGVMRGKIRGAWSAHNATNYERLINGALARMGDDDAAKDVNNGVIG